MGEKAANREDFLEISEEDLTRRKDHTMRSQTDDVPQKVPKILKNRAEDKKLRISFQTLTKETAVKQKRQQEKICTFCNRRHSKGKNNCGAFNKRCYKCDKSNHFAAVCRTNGLRHIKCATVSKFVSEVQKQPVANERTLLKNGSNNLKEDSKTHREEWKNQEILYWINKKLNANYCALGELKDGKGLNALIGKVLEYEYSESSLQSWQNIEDVLLMHDMETHIPLDELKCCNEDALRKMIKWLRDEEKISR